MSANKDSNLITRESDGVGWIIIDRIEKLNALSRATVDELTNAVSNYEKRDDIQVLVIRGAGDKAFSAGADISEFEERSAREQMEYIDAVTGLYDRIDLAEIPVIAAINGVALGGGAELTLSCDIRVATESATFSEAEINVGLVPAANRLISLVGEGIAMELCLTGRQVDAKEAKELGIFNRVVAEEKLKETVIELTEELTSKTAISLKLTKQTVIAARENSQEDATAHNYTNFHRAFEAKETKERIKEFVNNDSSE
jgi:enoyl-CoA hydratase/carnithine racemase